MTGPRMRRNPRDRASMRQRRQAAPEPGTGTARRIADGTPLVAVLVAGEAGAPTGRETQAIAAARTMAADLEHGLLVICTGPEPLAAPGELGADRVALAMAPSAEDLCETLKAAMADHDIAHVIAMEGGVEAEALRRLAAATNRAIRTNVARLDASGAACLEDAGRLERQRDHAPLMLLAPDRFRPGEAGHVGAARALALAPLRSADPVVRVLGLEQPDAANLPLDEADLILSAGAGVTDWDRFHRLARALDAAEGGSRVVCDAGHLPRARQVGASGTLVSPRFYIALGISGAMQHLQGIETCRRVVAVNTDPDAQMMKRADVAIRADTGALMQALLDRLETPK